MPTKNPVVDAHILKAKTWSREMQAVRKHLLAAGLTEELKWGKPCYELGGGKVAIFQPYKAFLALGFFKGSLLKDKKKVLDAPGQHSQAMRQLRFTSVEEIEEREPLLKAYIKEAVDLEKAGARVEFKARSELDIPVELQKQLDKKAALKKAFAALTPGRQRQYVLHISGAKQASTREARVEKCIPIILAGKGLSDR